MLIILVLATDTTKARMLWLHRNDRELIMNCAALGVGSSCSAHKTKIPPKGISQRRKGAKENHYRPQWPPPSPLKGELRRADKSLAVSSGYTGDLKPERLAYSSPGHRPGCSANILLEPYRGGILIQCKGMLPLQGAECGGHFITQGVAVGLNYSGLSALKCE